MSTLLEKGPSQGLYQPIDPQGRQPGTEVPRCVCVSLRIVSPQGETSYDANPAPEEKQALVLLVLLAQNQ